MKHMHVGVNIDIYFTIHKNVSLLVPKNKMATLKVPNSRLQNVPRWRFSYCVTKEADVLPLESVLERHVTAERHVTPESERSAGC